MMRDDAVCIAAKFGLWSGLAAIAFVTLSPIELRPHVAELQTEHLAAFAVVGCLAAFAHPRRLAPAVVFIILAAACLEAAQHFVPGRHARMVDFAMKAIGGVLGLGLGWVAKNRLRVAGGSGAH